MTDGIQAGGRDDQRRSSVERALAGGFLSLVILVVGSLWIPSGRPVLCPMRLLFGIPCPTCGITRSVSAILHGHLAVAFELHLLGPVVVLAAVAVLVAAAAQLAGRPVLDRAARFGLPAFYLALGIEIVFVWPPSLYRHLADGWAIALGQGLIPRFLHFIFEVLHVA